MSNLEARKSGSPTNSGHQQLSVPSTTLQQFSNFLPPSNVMTTALDHYRLSQLYQYALAADRLRGPLPNSSAATGTSPATAFQHSAITAFRPEMAAAAAAAAVPLLYNNPYYRLDPRLALYRTPEEPKPQHSYIGLIAMAILSSVDKKLVLSDIYQYILDNYAYFRTRGPGWRNSIRHNLSLNDCFVKAGRSANGKGHYWAIHPANIEDFQKGDFRRRKAQRKVRRHMGLAVDDEDSPSPPPNSPPPLSILRHPPDVLTWQEHPNFIRHSLTQHLGLSNIGLGHLAPQNLSVSDTSLYTGNIPVGFNKYITSNSSISDFPVSRSIVEQVSRNASAAASSVNKLSGRHKKRQFDVASLLAPETIKEALQHRASPSSSGNGEHVEFENNDHYSVSPAEKMYDNKTRCSSSSSSFQVHSDEEEEQRDDDGKAESGNASKTPERSSRSQSPSVNIAVDNNDLLPVNAFGMNVPRSEHVHARRLSQRRHFRSRRLVRIGDNNNKEQPATNCLNSRRLLSMNENNTRGFNSDLPFPTGQGQSQESNSERSHPNTNELFFQQNPSLASLMMLSSRYREITSSIQLQQQMTAKKS